ncbi:MAG: hypothetical protein KHY89_02130 [Butyricicoccus pullicaecorum]|nr:hypothetical protein [Butyricicoccus pullicaecorum]
MKNYRIINLELTLPAVHDIPERISRELREARRHKIQVMKLIHGYGSSGKGGKLRLAVRRQLVRAQESKQIICFIPGEQFSIFDADTQRALHTCAELRHDPDLERHNNGITLVVFHVSH